MSEFASGRHANAVCDICSVRTEYNDLKQVIRAGVPTNLYACTYCWDKDHPQLFLGRKAIKDPQTLRRARPDPSLAESRMFFDKAGFLMPPVSVLPGRIKATEWYPYQATLQRDALPGPYKSGEGIIITDNAVADLHGYLTRKIVPNGNNVTVTAIVSQFNPVVTEFVIRCQDISGGNLATDVFNFGPPPIYLGAGAGGGTGVSNSRTIEQLPGGWARYTCNFSIAAGALTILIFVAPRSGGSASYVGTGITTIGVMADPVIS